MRIVLLSVLAITLISPIGEAQTSEPLWVQIAKLHGSDTNVFDDFGDSVAIEGATLVVGARAKEGGGAAYIFDRDPDGPTTWIEAKKLTPGLESDTNFGSKVRISGDTIVVGSSADFEMRVAYHFYERDAEGPGTWGRVARFVTARGRNGLALGSLILASGDVLTDDGVVDLFEREDPEGPDWSYVTTLVAADDTGFFGGTLAVSGDLLHVGATNDRALGLDAGAAYVFKRELTGAWTEVVKLLASDGDDHDDFSFALDLDVSTAIVGAPGDEELGGNSGSGYIFERDALGNWMEVKKLLASDGDIGDSLGDAVAIDGNVAAAGAWNHDLPEIAGAGAVYVFERNAGGVDAWGQAAKVIASDPRRSLSFGRELDLDGNTFVVGVSDDDDLGITAGAIYLFSRTEPLLAATGSCPGKLQVTLIGATPSSPVILVGAHEKGATPIPVGPCKGVELGLDNPKVLFAGRVTSGGDLELTPMVGEGTCGRYLQAVDVTTCALSDTTQLP